ncbi:MAG: RNase adapter RapZ [Alphaproteobacteria bacterium]|nr:RNase adapter RapZ [Alphaproteobacteria bacterium]
MTTSDESMLRRLVLVTGMSGAGRSVALKELEDLGFEAIDNIPLAMLDGMDADPSGRPLAVGIDTRARDFAVEGVLERMTGAAARFDIVPVFLHADEETLTRRYRETRRRHPMAPEDSPVAGIERERRLLEPLRRAADIVIDTSLLNVHDLRRLLRAHFTSDPQEGMSIFVTSFSFRLGLPREADLVFDMRFLSNPHYIEELRPLTGRDEEVGAHIAKDPDFASFLEGVGTLLRTLLPRYAKEGRAYLTIAVGCTGGRHRSVFTAEELARLLRDRGWRATLTHRDLEAVPASGQDYLERAADRAVALEAENSP